MARRFFLLVIILSCFLPVAVSAESTGPMRLDLATASEKEVLEQAAPLKNQKNLDRPERERARLAIARRLRDVGTRESKELLNDYLAEPPQVKEEIVICRSPEPVALYRYDVEAREALWWIAVRKEKKGLRGKDVDELLASAQKAAPDSARFAASLAVLEGLEPSQQKRALERLRAGASEEPANAQRLLARLLVSTQSLPTRDEVRTLSQSLALRLLRKSADWPAEKRVRLLERLGQREDLRSAVQFERKPGGEISEQLREGGASAVAQLARDHSPERTGQFRELLSANDAELQRLAVLGLMLQRTTEAKQALRNVLEKEALTENLRKEIRGWLGE